MCLGSTLNHDHTCCKFKTSSARYFSAKLEQISVTGVAAGVAAATATSINDCAQNHTQRLEVKKKTDRSYAKCTAIAITISFLRETCTPLPSLTLLLVTFHFFRNVHARARTHTHTLSLSLSHFSLSRARTHTHTHPQGREGGGEREREREREAVLMCACRMHNR